MSFKTQLLELEKQKAQIQALEAKLTAERQASLAALPHQFGYPDLPSFIKALRSACRGNRSRKPRATKQPEPIPATPIGQGMAKSIPPKSSEPALPTGNSLKDPTNFGVLPDTALLKSDLNQDQSAKARLTEALTFAARVLHTSKVPASVWREWRQFERQATELLRLAKWAQLGSERNA